MQISPHLMRNIDVTTNTSPHMSHRRYSFTSIAPHLLLESPRLGFTVVNLVQCSATRNTSRFVAPAFHPKSFVDGPGPSEGPRLPKMAQHLLS
eukprot:3069840-Pyramimonas_sp.AAC.1